MHTHDITVDEATYNCNVNGDFSGDVIFGNIHTSKVTRNTFTAATEIHEVRIPFAVLSIESHMAEARAKQALGTKLYAEVLICQSNRSVLETVHRFIGCGHVKKNGNRSHS